MAKVLDQNKSKSRLQGNITRSKPSREYPYGTSAHALQDLENSTKYVLLQIESGEELHLFFTLFAFWLSCFWGFFFSFFFVLQIYSDLLSPIANHNTPCYRH